MRGSVALWYDAIDGTEGPAGSPIVELHINLWRDLRTSANFFDVGLLLRNVHALRRFFLFVPGPIGLDQIGDLSRLLLQGDTLNAVFNDVIDVQQYDEDSFSTLKDRKPFLRVHHVQPQSDLFVEVEDYSPGVLGTVINFKQQLCDRLRARPTENHYIRIRITFDRRTEELFSSEVDPQDWWLLSSFSRIELTEFRLNERRSLPSKIAKRADGHSFSIERVHYFLVRDFRHELVLQHADFRKVRRLEAELWRHYLRGRLPGDNGGPDVLPQRAGERMVIYHWREDGKIDQGKLVPVEDFIAFASFRSPTPNIPFYAVVIVLVGALGAAMAAAMADALGPIIVPLVRRWFESHDSDEVNAMAGFVANGATFVLLIALALAGATALNRVRTRKKRKSRST